MRARKLFSPGHLYFALVAFFLYTPIILLIIFSFNDSTSLAFPLKGFTFRWYLALSQADMLREAVVNSVLLGLGASLVATLLGSMAAIGIVRFRFPGRGTFLAIASMPMVIPYVVLGVGMLIAFSQAGIHLSLWTVGLGHVVITMPYAMLIVASRLAGFDASLEEAAADLGASYPETLIRVTLPICAPAILAAFLDAFTTSFDEFALAFFLIGTEPTLPIYLYSQLRFPSRLPLVVTLAAIIMALSVSIMILAEVLRRAGQATTPRGNP